MLRAFVIASSFVLASCTSQPEPPSAPPPSPSQNPALYPCASQTGEQGIEFSGSLILNEKFLPRRPQPEELNAAVKEQLRFIVGFLRSEPGSTERGVFLSAHDPEIKITGQQKTTYGLDLKLSPAPGSFAPYISKALARGHTDANDPALRVFYRAKLVVSFCSDATPLLTLSLPSDPYLAYWMVQKRNISFEGTTASSNPCASPSIAKINFPQHYWWMFSPFAQGEDADGLSFDCSALLRPAREVGTFLVNSWKPPVKPFSSLGSFLSNAHSLNATLLFGPTQYLWTMEPEVEAAASILGRLRKREEIRSFLEQVPRSEKHLHREAYRFLEFWSQLLASIEPDRWKITRKKKHLLIEVNAHLKQSHRKLRMTIYFGPVDNTPKGKAEHWPYLLQSLQHDELLLYFGRAGLGDTMSLASLKRELRLSTPALENALAKKPHQLLSFLSPHAYSFFGSDIVGLRNKLRKGQTTDLLLTTQFGNPGIFLGLLSYLDFSMAGKSREWSEWTDAYLENKERLFFASAAAPVSQPPKIKFRKPKTREREK